MGQVQQLWIERCNDRHFFVGWRLKPGAQEWESLGEARTYMELWRRAARMLMAESGVL